MECRYKVSHMDGPLALGVGQLWDTPMKGQLWDTTHAIQFVNFLCRPTLEVVGLGGKVFITSRKSVGIE